MIILTCTQKLVSSQRFFRVRNQTEN